jgi:hypothetical protein
MTEINGKYTGKERRSGEERRDDFCGRCSGIMRGLEDVVSKNKANCHNLEKTQERMETKFTDIAKDFDNKCLTVESKVDSKVPMKLFYVMVALVVSILAFQWTTYERMGTIALSHEHGTGELASQIKEIKTVIQGNQRLRNLEILQLKNAVERNTKITDEELDDLERSINQIKHVLKNNDH